METKKKRREKGRERNRSMIHDINKNIITHVYLSCNNYFNSITFNVFQNIAYER